MNVNIFMSTYSLSKFDGLKTEYLTAYSLCLFLDAGGGVVALHGAENKRAPGCK